jgi:hypothetical protein
MRRWSRVEPAPTDAALSAAAGFELGIESEIGVAGTQLLHEGHGYDAPHDYGYKGEIFVDEDDADLRRRMEQLFALQAQQHGMSDDYEGDRGLAPWLADAHAEAAARAGAGAPRLSQRPKSREESYARAMEQNGELGAMSQRLDALMVRARSTSPPQLLPPATATAA